MGLIVIVAGLCISAYSPPVRCGTRANSHTVRKSLSVGWRRNRGKIRIRSTRPLSSMQRWCRFMTIDDAFELTIFSHGIKSFNSNCYCYARQLFRPSVVIARNAHFLSSLSRAFFVPHATNRQKRGITQFASCVSPITSWKQTLVISLRAHQKTKLWAGRNTHTRHQHWMKGSKYHAIDRSADRGRV